MGGGLDLAQERGHAVNNPMMNEQRRDGQGQWTDSPNRSGGGWNDPGQGGREGGQGSEGRLRPLSEAAGRIDPAQAKAEVDRMVASGKVSRLVVDALYRQAAALV